MELEYHDLGEAARVSLAGRLDTPGVDRIETRFTATVVPRGRNALVDLSQVTFLSSMGIRMLIATAHALSLRNAKMVVFGAPPLVQETLEHASLASIIPVASTEAEAMDLLKAA
jgi:anti-anti-sigma factor